MPSAVAKKVAGTYIEDEVGNLPPVYRWAMQQCRHGSLADYVQHFCSSQTEQLDPLLVQVENVTSEHIRCRIPCRLYDHESVHPYSSEVLFLLDPATGTASRLA
jgi:hypothetical protein